MHNTKIIYIHTHLVSVYSLAIKQMRTQNVVPFKNKLCPTRPNLFLYHN